MQTIVDNHTKCMVRARPKYKRSPSTSLPASMRDFMNSNMNTRTRGISRDGQGYHHLPPIPQPWDTVISEGSYVPEHHAMYKETTHIPLVLRPYGSTSIGHGQTRRKDEPPPQLSSNSNHISYMNG